MSDVVLELSVQAERKEEEAREATAAAKELRLAIEAIRASREVTVKPLKKRQPRGTVTKGIRECVRDGMGTPKEVHAELQRRGIKAAYNTVYNTLDRLRARGELSYNDDMKKYHTPRCDAAKNGAGGLKPQSLHTLLQ